MKVFVGADYRGFEMKGAVTSWLESRGFEAVDLGAHEYVEGDDFNGPARAVAKAVVNDSGARGVLICGSGDGVCIQANRFRGVRAVLCRSAEEAVMAREHDDANVLCLSAEFLADFEPVLEAFLGTEFQPIERRVRRIRKLDEEGDD